MSTRNKIVDASKYKVTQTELRFVRELAKQSERMLKEMRVRAETGGVESGKMSMQGVTKAFKLFVAKL